MSTFKALQVKKSAEGKFIPSVITRDFAGLPPGEVLIKVRYSSLNYKDALYASGRFGNIENYSHTPGIDAAGIIEATSDPRFNVGQEVIVTGYDLGMNTLGGFSQYIRVPANWVIKKPNGLTLRESMVLGTAGLTAALCVDKLLQMGVKNSPHGILVTGASGGVGSVAIAILHKLKFRVIASTGKLEQEPLLKSLGADDIIDRRTLSEANSKPMLKGQWDGAVDSVGGDTLSNVVKSISYNGSVACCGLVQSAELTTSVIPFILRNINLLGIDSVELPLQKKQDIWNKLASDWYINNLESLTQEISLTDIPEYLGRILKGDGVGRVIVNLEH